MKAVGNVELNEEVSGDSKRTRKRGAADPGVAPWELISTVLFSPPLTADPLVVMSPLSPIVNLCSGVHERHETQGAVDDTLSAFRCCFVLVPPFSQSQCFFFSTCFTDK